MRDEGGSRQGLKGSVFRSVNGSKSDQGLQKWSRILFEEEISDLGEGNFSGMYVSETRLQGIKRGIGVENVKAGEIGNMLQELEVNDRRKIGWDLEGNKKSQEKCYLQKGRQWHV